MSSQLFPPGYQIEDKNGKALSGAKLYIYDAGTTTDASTFLDDALSSPATQPIVADAAGRIAAFYVASGQKYKVVAKTSADVPLYTDDDISPAISSGGATLPVSSGGTGSATAAGARTNLSVPSQATVTALSSTVSAISTEQAEATWEAGTGTTATIVTPANIKAAITALSPNLSGIPDAVIYDLKSSGSGGGTFTSGAWQTRSLNTLYDPDGHVTLVSNAFTFDADGWVSW
ncbi:MAG: hypothetical protein WBD01_14885, partial [Salaquimonas sp.]